MRTADLFGRTLVHAAVIGLSVECLRIVLMAGGDYAVVDNHGRSALHLCSIATVLGQEFTRNGAGLFFDSLKLADSQLFYQHFQPRVSALSSANEICEILLRLGADVNLTDCMGCAAIHFAAAFDTGGSLISLLLEFGANPWTIARWDNEKSSCEPLDFDALHDLIDLAVGAESTASETALNQIRKQHTSSDNDLNTLSTWKPTNTQLSLSDT
ncbi:hypothetical protein Ciccas_009497, partial [Cichlidogyrus casuarinus]